MSETGGVRAAEQALGARLQEVRRQKGFTQQLLCQKANLSYSTLAKIERGAIKSPSIFTIQRIATTLGVSLDELIGGAKEDGRELRHTASGVGFVYFDVNGCLVHGFQRAFTALATQSGVSPDVIETLFWRYNDEINRGTMSIDDFNEVLTKRLGQPVDWAEAYYGAVEPVPGMQAMMAEAAKYFKVGLFTNSMPGLVQGLLSRGVLPELRYDALVDSSEIGVSKPDPKAYKLAAQRSGCAADEILLIDDTRNCLTGAEDAGWSVLQYDGALPTDSLQRVAASLELPTPN
jgi:HAD superfamily hydrolase (TIGR01509 family)